MNRKAHWILLSPGIWTVATLAMLVIADTQAHQFPKPFSDFILISWVVTIPSAVIGSIIGIFSSLRRQPPTSKVMIFAYAVIILASIYLCVAFINLPNLGG